MQCNYPIFKVIKFFKKKKNKYLCVAYRFVFVARVSVVIVTIGLLTATFVSAMVWNHLNVVAAVVCNGLMNFVVSNLGFSLPSAFRNTDQLSMTLMRVSLCRRMDEQNKTCIQEPGSERGKISWLYHRNSGNFLTYRQKTGINSAYCTRRRRAAFVIVAFIHCKFHSTWFIYTWLKIISIK